MVSRHNRAESNRLSGLRTISLRLRGTEVSKDLEALGEDIDGLVSSSKMRDKIMSLSGVDILTDTGAYKSTYEIITEIARVWEDMSDMDQAALLELMAGKNRSNIMAALLTNLDDLKGAYEDALDAEGSAYRENEAYLDSIQGRVDLFTNSLQTMWMNLISSDMAKSVVDIGTVLIKILDTTAGKITAIAAGFAIYKRFTTEGLTFTKMFDGFTNVLSQVASSIKVTIGATQALTKAELARNLTSKGLEKSLVRRIIAEAGLKGVTGALTKEQIKNTAATLTQIYKAKELTAAQYLAAMSTMGLKAAVQGLWTVLMQNPVYLVAAAVTVAALAFDKFNTTAQEAADAAKEAFDKVKSVVESTESTIQSLESELSTINDKINELDGKKLSFAEDQELQRLKGQRKELEHTLETQNNLLKLQKQSQAKQAVASMKAYTKAASQGAEETQKTWTKALTAIGVAVGAVGATILTGGIGLPVIAAAVAGGVAGNKAGEWAGSKTTENKGTYNAWYETYTKALDTARAEEEKALKEYENDSSNIKRLDKWQEAQQKTIDIETEMYNHLSQMSQYYNELEYGISDEIDKELDTWYNFLDKMYIDQEASGAKVNAIDRIFGENASYEVKKFKKEIDKAIKDKDNKFDIAAEIEGREDLQDLEDQLADIGITTDEVSDYFRQTGEIGTKAFSDLSGEITAAETALTKLQAALDNNTNQGYETRNTAIEEMKDLMKQGLIGSESNLWNIAEAMGFTYDSAKSIEENADALYNYIKARDAWYQVDEDGNWGTAGADAFAKDIENAVKNSKKLHDELGVKWDFNEETGELDFDFNNMEFDDIVKALGDTKEAAGLTNEEFIDMLTHLGQFYDIQWSNGNDIVSYLKHLEGTSLSAEEQLAAVQKPLEQLLGQQGLNSDQIEAYLTGNGSLKKLPEDLQAAVKEYRKLRKETTLANIEGLTDKDRTLIIEAVTKYKNGGDIDDLIADINSIEDEEVRKQVIIELTEANTFKELLNDLDEADREIIIKAITTGEGKLDELNLAIDRLPPEVQSQVRALVDGAMNDIEVVNGELQEVEDTTAVADVEIQDNASIDIASIVEKLISLGLMKASPSVSVAVTGLNLLERAKELIRKLKGESDVDGTAHAWGTAHANGTAYAGGNWGASRTETALVGELGPEILVRDGRWTTIGENGAEFTGIKKGDIIFNHRQAEELLKNGYVTSGGGRGKAYAEGTAYAGGGGRRKTYTFSYDSSSDSVKKKSSSKKSSSKKSKETKDEFEEVFDWFEIRIEEINEQLDLMAARLENAITIEGKNGILNDMIAKNKSELKTLEKGSKLYEKYAKDALKDVPKEYRKEAEDGKIAIEEFYGKVDEGTLEAIKNYREWAQKAADVKQQIQETKREITELAKQKFDNIVEKYNNITSLQDNRQQHYLDMADYREDKGWINSDKYYKAAIAEEEKQRDSLKNEKKKLQKSLDASVKNGNIKKYSSEWYEMVNQIHEVDAALDESKATIEEYQNRINEIHFENFEKGLYRVSRLAEETQNIIDLMATKDVVNDDAEFTAEGKTQMGLYAQQMENYKKQSELYAEEIDHVTKMYDNGQMSFQEYLEKLDELKDGQYEAIQGYEDSKEAIIDLQKARVDAIKEGIDEEIEAYEELIDKKREELSAEKDLYDFQRNVEDQSKDIADIQRKLAALSGDNSAAAMAKRRQLEAELKSAEQGLEDTYYDRSIENKQTALDNQLEFFTETREAEKEMWDKYLEDTEQVFKDSLEIIAESGNTVKDTLRDVANDWDLQINKHIKEPWENATTALETTADRLDDVIKKFDEAAKSAGKTASEQISDQKDVNKNITGQESGGSGNDSKQEPVKGLTVTADKGTQAYDAKGNKDFKLGYDSSYTVLSTDSKTGMTKVKNADGEIRYFKTSDLSTTRKFRKGTEINAKGAKIYESATDSTGETQGMTNYTVTAVDTKKKRVKAKAKKKSTSGKYKGKYREGWFKYSDVTIKKYAKGSKKIDKDQLAWLDELGDELQIVPDGTGRLDYVKKGTGILTANMTERLMDLAMNPQDMLDRSRPTISVSPEINNTEINLNIQYGDMLKIENFKGDNPEEIAKIVAKQFEKHTKDLNSALRKYVR